MSWRPGVLASSPSLHDPESRAPRNGSRHVETCSWPFRFRHFLLDLPNVAGIRACDDHWGLLAASPIPTSRQILTLTNPKPGCIRTSGIFTTLAIAEHREQTRATLSWMRWRSQVRSQDEGPSHLDCCIGGGGNSRHLATHSRGIVQSERTIIAKLWGTPV